MHRGTQTQAGGHHGSKFGEGHKMTKVASMSCALPVRVEELQSAADGRCTEAGVGADVLVFCITGLTE